MDKRWRKEGNHCSSKINQSFPFIGNVTLFVRGNILKGNIIYNVTEEVRP